MAFLDLPDGRIALLDDIDLRLVRQHRWYVGANGYVRVPSWTAAQIGIVYLHRFILKPGPGVIVDHRNGDRTDNRRCNLRLCTPQQNAANRKPHGATSTYKGVWWSKERQCWRSSCGRQHLGYFDNEIEAAHAYDLAAIAAYGEFAWVNLR